MNKLPGSQKLPVALLLALIGGFFEAYTYYERGGVFANAQTGNIVKMVIHFAEHENALPFLMSILAFVAGVLLVLIIRTILSRRHIKRARVTVLSIEMALSIAIGFVPESGNMLVTTVVAFICAMQLEAFKSFEGLAAATTMSTGNLGKFIDAMYDYFVKRNQARRREGLLYGAVILTFVAGVYLGVVATDLLHKAASMLLAIPYALAIAYIVAHNRKLRREEEKAAPAR